MHGNSEEGEKKKNMNVEDLRKALLEKVKTSWQISLAMTITIDGQALLSPQEQWIRKKDVEAFLVELRKQLSERIGQLERKINEGRAKVDGAEWLKNASEPATFVHYLQGRKDALEKELLEART